MTILQYSGRGGGRGGGGRGAAFGHSSGGGRGRGYYSYTQQQPPPPQRPPPRSYAASHVVQQGNKKWVRPPAAAAAVTELSYDTGTDVRTTSKTFELPHLLVTTTCVLKTDSEEQKSSPFAVEKVSTAAFVTNKDKSCAPTRLGRNVWKRPQQEKHTDVNDETSNVGGSSFVMKSVLNPETALLVNGEPMPAAAESNQVLNKVAPNKLVRKDNDVEKLARVDINMEHATNSSTSSADSVPQLVAEKKSLVGSNSTNGAYEAHSLKKVAPNKLIRKVNEDSRSVNDTSNEGTTGVRNQDCATKTNGFSVSQTTYRRVAFNKLIGEPTDTSCHATLKYSKKLKRTRRPSRQKPVAKRIKVTAHQSEVPVSSSSGGESDADKPETTAKKETKNDSLDEGKVDVVEKLTDFAYRGVKGHRLIRVQSTGAAICPTFLRGVACMDETCMKRHDVPPEHAMPVCVYFQRHGMCLKENCRFRHVKVNPRATLCPSFDLLGFCDDPSCTMMHRHRRDSEKKMSKEV